MTLQKDKSEFIMKYSLAPYFEEVLLQGGFCFTIPFIKKKLHQCQMKIFVRYWNDNRKNVEIRYLTSQCKCYEEKNASMN